MSRRTTALPLLLLTLLASSREASGQTRLPIREVLIALKVLSYDAKLQRGGKDALRVGVLYDPSSEASRGSARSLEAAFAKVKEVTVQKMAVRHALVPVTSEATMLSLVREMKLNVFFLAAGLGGQLKAILGVSRRLRINVITVEERLVLDGVPVAVFLEKDQPRITINRAAAQAHGCEFASGLFKVARLVKPR